MTARTIRPFADTDDDFRALADMQSAVYPDYPFSAAEMRHEDESWDHSRFFKRRWVAEADGAPTGWVQLNHSRHAFVPTTYWVDFGVRPEARRRGHGTALYDVAVRT